MPGPLARIAIVVLWAAMTVALVQRDVLPGLLIGPPPDLRTLVRTAPRSTGPTRWNILVAEGEDVASLRSVGEARTRFREGGDGWVNIESTAWFDSKELLRGTPLESGENERVFIRSLFAVDSAGNLDRFRIGVKLGPIGPDLVVVDGGVESNDLEVRCHGPVPLLNWSRTFPYTSHSLLQNTMGPLDWMPGLNVGQRWTSRIVSPLTGRIEDVALAVERRALITWEGNPVRTFEVVSRAGSTTLRTWVRPDGLVLRQEVPFPLARLILERIEEQPQLPATGDDGWVR